jgi:hypothetical protein
MKAWQIRDGDSGGKPDLVGITCPGRNERDRVRPSIDQAPVFSDFSVNEGLEQRALVLVEVLHLCLMYPLRHRGHKRIGIDLAMRMVKRDSDLGAPVLKRHHVAYLRMSCDASSAVREHLDKKLYVIKG